MLQDATTSTDAELTDVAVVVHGSSASNDRIDTVGNSASKHTAVYGDSEDMILPGMHHLLLLLVWFDVCILICMRLQ